ncbi:MAG: aspartate-semialdehyde dehydrogenase [Planctomycetota bacterium]
MGFHVAIAGVTGAVGQEFLNVLADRKFPISKLTLLASERSKGKKITFKGKEYTVDTLTKDSFKGVDFALFSASAGRSREFRDAVVASKALMIDNSSAFRMEEGTPLVIPEVNPQDARKHKGTIANPNCSTIIMAVPMYPLYQAFGVARMHISTYQAASGAGAKAMEELKEESAAILAGKPYIRTVIPFQYAFNLFPHNSAFGSDGYCEEETKMLKETRKIYGDPTLRINAACVRVPVLRAHSEAVNVQFKKPATVEGIYALLRKAPGVTVLEDPSKNRWPMPIDASGKYDIMVGRVRKDQSQDNTFDLWMVGDQLLKGAALNAVQIAELFV